MALEIEKKFLLRQNGLSYVEPAFFQFYESIVDLEADSITHGKRIRQGYLELSIGIKMAKNFGLELNFNPVEARLRDTQEKCFFTLKGNGNVSRNEVERIIDPLIFDRYWDKTLERRVEKMRIEKKFGIYVVEFDVYVDRDLILAEIEVPTPEHLTNLPILGRDVTEDSRYKNKNLAK